MDEEIRRLERQYLRTGHSDDIWAWLRAVFRAGLNYSFQEEFSEIARFVGLPWTQSLGPLAWQRLLVSEPVIFRTVACIRSPWSVQRLSNEQIEASVAPPSLELYFYTLSQTPIDCPYCEKSGPHICAAYYHQQHGGHPYRAGVTLPVNPRWYGLVPPEQSHHDELIDTIPGTTRQWYPIRTRQMQQEYRYEILRWTARPHPLPVDTQGLVLQNGWSIAAIDSLGQVRNSDALHLWVDRLRSGSFRDLIEITDAVRIPEELRKNIFAGKGNCTIITDRRIFPIPIGHEKPEPVPFIVTGPCDDFEIIPKGGTVFIPELNEYVPTGITVTLFEESGTPGVVTIPHAVEAYDTSTACQHGHIDGFPLCPPRWSDTGKPAAIHCESCARLLPLNHTIASFSIRNSSGEYEERSSPFHNCDDCLARIRRSAIGNLEYLADYMLEPGRGLWYFCQNCDDEGDGGYTEEICYCFELAAEEGSDPPTLEKRYRCPSCPVGGHAGYQLEQWHNAYSWYPTPQQAIDCCTKINLWDFSNVIEAYLQEE